MKLLTINKIHRTMAILWGNLVNASMNLLKNESFWWPDLNWVCKVLNFAIKCPIFHWSMQKMKSFGQCLSNSILSIIFASKVSLSNICYPSYCCPILSTRLIYFWPLHCLSLLVWQRPLYEFKWALFKGSWRFVLQGPCLYMSS